MNTQREQRKAIFIGWQDIPDESPMALFNVLCNDKKYPHGSTVDVNSLIEWRIRVPEFPDYDSWKAGKKVLPF